MFGGHIAYGVVPEHRGHNYAARACRLLLSLARGHGLKTLWITCDPDNLASRITCKLAGAELVEIVDLPEDTDMYQEGERQKCRYRLDLLIGSNLTTRPGLSPGQAGAYREFGVPSKRQTSSRHLEFTALR